MKEIVKTNLFASRSPLEWAVISNKQLYMTAHSSGEREANKLVLTISFMILHS